MNHEADNWVIEAYRDKKLLKPNYTTGYSVMQI